MRKTVIILALIFAGPIIWYVSSLWANNRATQPPEPAELTVSLENAINWLEANMNGISGHKNPPLWWMIKQSAEVSQNPRLVSFYESHEHKLLNNGSWYIWSKLFNTDASVKLPQLNTLNNLPYYDYLFLYGLTCDVDWGNAPEVQRQLKLELCPTHLLHPRCVTYQLLGLRFMQRSKCGDAGRVQELIQGLQNISVTELTWDPRLTEAYIQRVLMLVDSGAIDRVKPIWIQRILDAQNSDGGWGGVDPILRFPDRKVLGFSGTKLVYGELRSNFHATAEGIWLISLLLAE